MVDCLSRYQGQIKAKELKKARYDIVNFSMKYLPKIIREFEKLTYKSYERRRLKHDPTNSCFYLARQIAKFMMRSDALKYDNYTVITEITGTK